jgi:hypothetical protein
VQQIKAAVGEYDLFAEFPESVPQLDNFWQGLQLLSGHGNVRG